eukprot:CAMPEP_0174284574 /NCGR_PEP_ID=MMETSP0809-20121228/5999_1 /TAXON_ID=73025 ORGANISM="Eutreptiella gymnastica-like, Strain CCMP1594" /NCGR_SAMPLE_ID=MMETSP0809 /ASSEMBLY_ACC=CAM_ASM_000658 /LENGTH=461 /DNA_ID=CAMNT_0015380119 /DNA_START=135 /DNA_END=1520 /DNA_ORIENTATION=-
MRSKSKKSQGDYPPIEQSGCFETIKQITSNDLPWFLLQAAKDLKSMTYQLNPLLAKMFFCPMFVVIGEPKLSHKILTDPLSTKPEELYEAVEAVHATGTKSMFTSNGPYWQSRRRGVATAFSSAHIRRMNDVASAKVDEWIQTELLGKFIPNDEAFDVGLEMFDLVGAALSETAFEYKMSKEEAKNYADDLDLAFDEFTFKSATNPLRKPFGLLLPDRQRAFAASKRVRAFALKLIASYRELENPTKDTIIDRVMKNTAYKSDDERVADLTFILVAGRDTTSFTIAFILRELAKHPSEQQKLREALLEARDNGEDLTKSDALRKVVKEGMRLYPVAAAGAQRTIGREYRTKEGYILPKGTVVWLPFLLPLRSEDIYADPDSFVPSRWDEPTEEMDEAFFPFALGQQNCVGQALAKAEMNVILARICSEFELELVDEGTLDHILTLKPMKAMLKARRVVSTK